jgi:hypothetical protein
MPQLLLRSPDYSCHGHQHQFLARHHRIIALVLTAGLASGCAVTPITTETSGPTITFGSNSVSNGQNLTSLNYGTTANTPAYLYVSATDNGGVKSLYVNFSSTVPFCNVNNGAVYSGVYIYSPQIPSASATSTPNSQGQVPNTLLTTSTIQGPFSCTVQGIGVGAPFGQTITVTASATNYSNRTTTSTLPITLQ